MAVVDLKKRIADLKAKAKAASVDKPSKKKADLPVKGAFKKGKKQKDDDDLEFDDPPKKKGKKAKQEDDQDKELFGGMTDKEMNKIERATDPKELDVATRRYLPQINETCALLRQIEKLNEEVFCAVGTLLFDRTQAAEAKWAKTCLEANDMGLPFKGEVEADLDRVLNIFYLAGFYVAEVKGKQVALAHQTGKAKAVVLPSKTGCKVATAKVA